MPFSRADSKSFKLKENVEDADEELGDEEERKGRREIIPSVFSNSRNLHEKGLHSLKQVVNI